MAGDRTAAARAGGIDADGPRSDPTIGEAGDAARNTPKTEAPSTVHFTVRRVTTGSCPLLSVQGPLTGWTAPLLDAALDPLTRPEGSSSGEVRVILTAVTEMTPAGARPLLRAERRLRRAGGRLVLSQPSPIARAVLSGTTLTGILRIDPPV